MKKWVISCNLNGYDILQDFIENGHVLYETNDDIEVDDEVYIYGESPLNAIFLKCKVKEIRKEEQIGDYIEKLSSRYINLKVVDNYLSIINEVNYDKLSKNGLKESDIDGQISKELCRYIDSLKVDSNINL